MNYSKRKNNSFLATEPLGRLLLKLSLPTVTAQVINMLYNIVDRIYIGHIPETGALALTGVGVCMPLIMIVSAFAALVGNGGAPELYFMGKGDKESCRTNPWKLFYYPDCCIIAADSYPFYRKQKLSYGIWCQ